MELLKVLLRGLVRRPANDETFILGDTGLGNDVEMNMVDFLVSDAPVVLRHA